jgi:hypothetical protein
MRSVRRITNLPCAFVVALYVTLIVTSSLYPNTRSINVRALIDGSRVKKPLPRAAS